MATYNQAKTVSVEAGSAVTIYRFVSVAADKQYDHTGAGARMEGISAETVSAAGDALAMVIPNGGIVKVEAGAAIAVNAIGQSDASGRVITHVSGVGVVRAGKVLDAAAAAGEIVRLQFLVDEDQVA